MSITEKGIELQAATDLGALHGLETILQLLRIDENGITLPELSIFDEPRFPWRGLMIDSSRHFMPVEMVKRNLDGMAAVKLNVLHWHLVDDQGFRVESLALPKLHELGSDGDYYSQAQIRDIIDYAGDRGIRVVPEFDLPGHGSAWLTAYPELGERPGPLRDRAQLGHFRPHRQSHHRGDLHVSRHTLRRDGRGSLTTSSSTSAATRTTASTGSPTRRSSPSWKPTATTNR